MSDLIWSTGIRKVKDLKGMPNNPRKMSKEQADQLTKSIKKFNLVEIPAIDQDGTIIAGHFRVSVLMSLGRGEEEIEVRVPNRPLTEEEREEYNLRSNKNMGDWDWDILANFSDVLLTEVGFTQNELDNNLLTPAESEEEKCICPECETEHRIKPRK